MKIQSIPVMKQDEKLYADTISIDTVKISIPCNIDTTGWKFANNKWRKQIDAFTLVYDKKYHPTLLISFSASKLIYGENYYVYDFGFGERICRRLLDVIYSATGISFSIDEIKLKRLDINVMRKYSTENELKNEIKKFSEFAENHSHRGYPYENIDENTYIYSKSPKLQKDISLLSDSAFMKVQKEKTRFLVYDKNKELEARGKGHLKHDDSEFMRCEAQIKDDDFRNWMNKSNISFYDIMTDPQKCLFCFFYGLNKVGIKYGINWLKPSSKSKLPENPDTEMTALDYPHYYYNTLESENIQPIIKVIE